ncbi:hypothetical protein [Bradyrhizobium elkanii]|uniref:hypothetical protein n=1 Tax=Bradyrhizobium elkanii TaxID=29448 RepID=UPI003D19C6D3
MRPKKQRTTGSGDLFRARLDQIINMKHDIARRSGSEERGDQDGESVSRRDDDRRDDCRAQEFCLL